MMLSSYLSILYISLVGTLEMNEKMKKLNITTHCTNLFCLIVIRSHDAPKIAQNMNGSMSGTFYIHVCEQATNMMVNMPSSFSFKMVQTQLRTCSKHYDAPYEDTAGSYCRKCSVSVSIFHHL